MIFFCYRFWPDIPWGDAPFNIHKVPVGQRTVPELPSPFLERNIINCILINAVDGIIAAMRTLSFTPEFTAELHLAIREQSAKEWSEIEYNATINKVFATMPTQILVDRAAMRCSGGE